MLIEEHTFVCLSGDTRLLWQWGVYDCCYWFPGSMGCYSLTTGMSTIAVCSDLTWEMINFRGVYNEVWWSGVGSLFNVSGETCCNDTHVAVRFYRRWINPINQSLKWPSGRSPSVNVGTVCIRHGTGCRWTAGWGTRYNDTYVVDSSLQMPGKKELCETTVLGCGNDTYVAVLGTK
jgi:hypothetical protein